MAGKKNKSKQKQGAGFAANSDTLPAAELTNGSDDATPTEEVGSPTSVATADSTAAATPAESGPNTSAGEEAQASSQAETTTVTKLHGTWTLWYDHPKLAPAGSDWKDNLKPMATFSTVEDFWRVYNNLLPPSMISVSSNYSVFRQGVEPTWEHPANVDGGKFVMTLPKEKASQQSEQQQHIHTVPKLDEYWLFTVLAVLGETMDATGDQVMGVVVSVRKNQDRVALWLKGNGADSASRQICVSIGERWKKVLDLEKTTLRYQTHKDAAATGRSFRIDVHFEV